VANRVKDLEIANTRLEKGQQEQGKLLTDLQDGQKALELKIETVNASVLHLHEGSERDHNEIMEHLLDNTDIYGEGQEALKKQVERIEEHLKLPPLK
jgi:hypothetical protein